ncbi:FMN reductase (sulfate starvation-induced protein [Escherichia coli]|nr:FMN reductase (sulfate starvation-induced protein [Escherichia coli]
MRVITLAGSPRFPSRSSSLLEYAREKLNGLDVEVYHWNLQNFAPEDLLYARSIVRHSRPSPNSCNRPMG